MQYDVAIVGAGPAGATAAKYLSERGMRTLLLEKTRFPREKPCGGGLPLRVLQRFKYIEEENLFDSYSYAIQIHSPSMRHQIDFQDDQPLQVMVRRNIFDEGLVKLGMRNGAVLKCGTTVTHFSNEDGKIRMALSDGTTVESQLMIGADGMWSTIAKEIGVKQECHHIGVCAYTEYPLGEETLRKLYGEERQVHIHLQPYGLAGYGWVFPKKEHVNIGVVEFRQAIDPAVEKKNLQTIYAQYLQSLKGQNLVPTDVSLAPTRGGAFPTCPADRLTTDRVLLCGDAAGLVNPATGEGIYYAMSSGEIAAKTAIKALENNRTDAQPLKQYQVQWNREFHMDLSIFYRLSKRWGRNIDTIVGLVSKDKKLIDIIGRAIPNRGGVQKEKWRIAYRFMLMYCKNRLGMN
jgi:geranylgeranyl reductase family protein